MADDDAVSTDTVSAVLRLRGLPFTSTEDDVKEFFEDHQLHQIFLCKRNGRSNGEAYVQLESPQSAKDALESLNRKHMGKRYIEIFEAQPSDLLAVKALSAESKAKGFVVRLRGLPYSATAPDVVKFFDGLDIVRGAEGVLFTFTPDGRPTGEAYAEFDTDDAHKEAMKRHKEMIGTRYIELFVSSKVDMYQAMHHNKYVSQTSKKRWLMHGGAVIDPSGMRHLPPYPGGVDEMSEVFRNFSLAPRSMPLLPSFGPNPGAPVNGMPGPGVGFVQMESQDDRQSGRHGGGARLHSPVPPRSGGMVAHHMGVPTYVSNHPGPKAQGPGGRGQHHPGAQQQHLPPMMAAVDFSAQQQMMMQQQMMQQQYLMQQQQAWGGMQGGGMPGSGMPPAPGVGGTWYKGYNPQASAGYGGNGYGGPPHGMYGLPVPSHSGGHGPLGALEGLQRHSGSSPHSLDVGVVDQAVAAEAVETAANASY